MPAAELFGPEEETRWLQACWDEGAHVATLVAPGGVGKSALVHDWLRKMQAADWGGAERVYGWSFYSQGTKETQLSADSFIHEALVFFGDPEPDAGSPWEKGERLARLVRKRRVLLVLDGMEPLQWGPGEQEGRVKDPALARLLRRLGEQSAGLCVITSRLPVREVGGFAKEKSRKLNLERLSEEAGAELLSARGVKGAPAELREAVREYKGHGLALVLLGSYLEEAVEGDVRRRDVIGPLVEDERVGGHAKRVMAAYEKMFGEKSVEVGMLRMLGLFDWPASEGEIEALWAKPVVVGLTDAVVGLDGKEWNRAVERLRRVGLVEREGREGDWRLDAHPLVREYFGERVRREQEKAWREGNRRLYEHLKGIAKPLPKTVGEMEPLYAAVAHGCRAGKADEARIEILADAHPSREGGVQRQEARSHRQ